jgi:hypothetical protein
MNRRCGAMYGSQPRGRDDHPADHQNQERGTGMTRAITACACGRPSRRWSARHDRGCPAHPLASRAGAARVRFPRGASTLRRRLLPRAGKPAAEDDNAGRARTPHRHRHAAVSDGVRAAGGLSRDRPRGADRGRRRDQIASGHPRRCCSGAGSVLSSFAAAARLRSDRSQPPGRRRWRPPSRHRAPRQRRRRCAR